MAHRALPAAGAFILLRQRLGQTFHQTADLAQLIHLPLNLPERVLHRVQALRQDGKSSLKLLKGFLAAARSLFEPAEPFFEHLAPFRPRCATTRIAIGPQGEQQRRDPGDERPDAGAPRRRSRACRRSPLRAARCTGRPSGGELAEAPPWAWAAAASPTGGETEGAPAPAVAPPSAAAGVSAARDVTLPRRFGFFLRSGFVHRHFCSQKRTQKCARFSSCPEPS